jgi:hypothetical protein
MTAAGPKPAARSANWAVNALCILIGLILFTVWALPNLTRTLNGENDFLQLYAGAKLVATPALYDVEASKQIHRQVTSDGNYYPSVYYTRLPYYALLLSPLAKLPYKTAYAVWQVFNLIVVGAFLVLYQNRYSEAIVFASLSVPLLVNFTNGQDAGLVAAVCGFGLILLGKGRDFEAGLLMSLASIKFHVLILVPIAVIFHRRWHFLRGGLLGAGVLLLLSSLADGWDWPRRFLAVVTNPELHPGPDHMVTLRNLAWLLSGGENRPLELALSLPVTALYAWLAWRIRDFQLAFALAIPAGLLVCHHAYSQDLLLLLVSLFVFAIVPSSRPVRGLTMALTLPPAVFMLFSGFPYSTIVPLLLLSILVAAAFADAHGPTSPRTGH